MAAGGHFVNLQKKTWKLYIDMKWREMESKVIFGHPKWSPEAILWKHFKQMKVSYWSEMARNAIKSDFWSSKNGSCVVIWEDGEKCDRRWFSVIQGHRRPFCKQMYVCIFCGRLTSQQADIVYICDIIAIGNLFYLNNGINKSYL